MYQMELLRTDFMKKEKTIRAEAAQKEQFF